MIVAGDIGGTHTRLGAFSIEGGIPKLETFTEYASRNYPGLADIVEIFIKTISARPRFYCFGVAGPVIDGVANVTNLAWIMKESELALRLGAPVVLINDLEANAYGIAALGGEDLVELQCGQPGEKGNAAVISAGTGLGEAGLFWDGIMHRPFACEGGHSTFAPRNQEEIALLEYLLAKYDHVSWERVLSGPGLLNDYQFLRDTGRSVEPPWLAEKLAGPEASAAIADAGLHKKSEICVRALDMFVDLYGSEAGNFALKTMAIAGMYVGGGIAPRILDKLKEGGFAQAFVAKGRMKATLERIPIHVITNDRTALLGAARCAALRLG